MSNRANAHFDDSEDEEDNFNPAPADLSDNEDARGSDQDDDAEAQILKDATRRSSRDDGSENGSASEQVNNKRRNLDGDVEQDDDEDADGGGEDTAPRADDDEEEDDEEEDDDDDEEEITGHRRKRRRERRNQFLDVEAEVDEDEDENDDDEDEINELKDNFIADTHPDDLADLPTGGETDDRRHRELDRRREMEANLDAEKQAEILRQRYANRGRSGRGMADSAVVPKRLLLPSVDDPSIWAVRCKEGKEREAVFSIMKRIEERMGTKDELAITAAFERGGTASTMKGFIYVEARRQADILVAMDGLMNVYPRTKMMLVEIKEMPDLLRVTKSVSLQVGDWVRLKRPLKYAGDLAQVLEPSDTGLELRVKYVPRLDYGLHDDANAPTDAFGAKRKRPATGPRPPQRLFSEVEAKKRHAKHLQSRGDKVWMYLGDEYVSGYCEKEVKIQTVSTKDVNPTLEEVTKFASGADDGTGTENIDLNALSVSLKQSTANASYQPGDIIEIYEGEQKGVVGKAVTVQGDIVTIAITDGALKGQTIEVPMKGLRKRFKEGDHVKVIGGSKYRDEVGMVVKIVDDKVTLLSDQGNTEITVFSKDLREASDSGGSGSLGKYELFDLVQLDSSTVACIIKVDRESLIVLDQDGQSRMIMPSAISNKIEKRKFAVATDRNGSEIRVDDVVKEHGGESRQGRIIHIYRAFLFLRNSATTENAGIFVARTTGVASISAKGGRVSGPDLNAMNPALKRNVPGVSEMAPPKSIGRDRSIGQTVTIRKGPYKGLLGIVKEATDTSARVELHTKNKTVNVPKDALGFKDKFSGQSIDPNGRGGRGGHTPRGGRGGLGGATPGGWDGGGRTPAVHGEVGRTPAWGTSRTPAGGANGGRTPAWKTQNDGGRTPGWADGSRTVNPYDGSRTAYGAGNRTPAWNSGAKTPAYGLSDGFAAGSKTPAYGSGDAWGSKTPAYQPQSHSNDNSWQNAPASNNNWGSGPYDAPTPGAQISAPTPAAMNAPTPGAYSAPTPAPYSAPTPAAAPTPAPGWNNSGWGAPTPQAMDAPTPGGANQYYAAPTPGAYGGQPETPAPNWQDDGPRYVD